MSVIVSASGRGLGRLAAVRGGTIVVAWRGELFERDLVLIQALTETVG